MSRPLPGLQVLDSFSTPSGDLRSAPSLVAPSARPRGCHPQAYREPQEQLGPLDRQVRAVPPGRSARAGRLGRLAPLDPLDLVARPVRRAPLDPPGRRVRRVRQAALVPPARRVPLAPPATSDLLDPAAQAEQQ